MQTRVSRYCLKSPIAADDPGRTPQLSQRAGTSTRPVVVSGLIDLAKIASYTRLAWDAVTRRSFNGFPR
jgi:hypothetical protein